MNNQNYKLPYINRILSKEDFYINFTNNTLKPCINSSLYNFLKQTKDMINGNEKLWDKYKKYTNPYEFIYTNYENGFNCVSKIKPLSRAFFKMIEITKDFNLLENLPSSIQSFHLAEGPGGFIEALLMLRKNKEDNYYGMTLQDTKDVNVPGWKKSIKFLKNNKNVIIENGIDNTGNLYNIDNFDFIYKKYKNSIDIVTGDGGFDFSLDYSKQEVFALRLIITQVIYALAIQKQGGSFILKIFDIFSKTMIDVIFLLSCFYEEVYIYKPNTSRQGNSEKYIICKNFKYDNIDFIYDTFYNIINTLVILDKNNLSIESILNIKIPDIYRNTLSTINAIYGQQQIENINNTFILMKNHNNSKEKINLYKKNNLDKSIQWCLNYNIPCYNLKENSFIKKDFYYNRDRSSSNSS